MLVILTWPVNSSTMEVRDMEIPDDTVVQELERLDRLITLFCGGNWASEVTVVKVEFRDEEDQPGHGRWWLTRGA